MAEIHSSAQIIAKFPGLRIEALRAVLDCVSDSVVIATGRSPESKLIFSNKTFDQLEQNCREDVFTCFQNVQDSGTNGWVALESLKRTQCGTDFAQDRGGEKCSKPRCSLKVSTVFDEFGGVLGHVGVVHDFHDARYEFRNFCDQVSHELRTPLTAMHCVVDLIGSGTAGVVSKNAKKFLRVAEQNYEQLKSLIVKGLELLLTDKCPLENNLDWVDLRDSVQQVVATVESLAEYYEVDLECKASSEMFVTVNRHQFEYALRALTIKLVQELPVGSHIEFRFARISPDMVRCLVQDDCGATHSGSSIDLDDFAMMEIGDDATGGLGDALTGLKVVIESCGGRFGRTTVPGVQRTYWFDLFDRRG